jgi:hypothetical protein
LAVIFFLGLTARRLLPFDLFPFLFVTDFRRVDITWCLLVCDEGVADDNLLSARGGCFRNGGDGFVGVGIVNVLTTGSEFCAEDGSC